MQWSRVGWQKAYRHHDEAQRNAHPDRSPKQLDWGRYVPDRYTSNDQKNYWQKNRRVYIHVILLGGSKTLTPSIFAVYSVSERIIALYYVNVNNIRSHLENFCEQYYNYHMNVFGHEGSAHIDERRAVVEMMYEFRMSDSALSYVQGLKSAYEDTSVFKNIATPIENLARQAMDVAYTSNHSAHKLSRTILTVPALSTSSPFKAGVAFGMDATSKTLGSKTDELLEPHISEAMELPRHDIKEYTDAIERRGRRTFKQGLSAHTISPARTPFHLRNFAEHVGRNAYPDANLLNHFKVGVGLARYAYNGYSLQINQQFRNAINGVQNLPTSIDFSD